MRLPKLGGILLRYNETKINGSALPKRRSAQPGSELLHGCVKHFELLLMVLPGLLLLLIFRYGPIYGLTIAFKDFNMSDGIWGSAWSGFENFRRLFAGDEFLKTFKNTLVISLLKLLFTLPAPIVLALLLNELKGTGFKRIVQSCTYIPYFFSWIVLSGIITSVFSTRGPVNLLFSLLGASKPVEFFGNGALFISMLIVTEVWKNYGWNSILYIATMSGIDESLYEAARIDGAGRWRQIISITIPCIIPTIVTVFILNLGGILNAGFDQIYNLYNPTVYDVSDIIDTYVLRRMDVMDYSLGTAAGLFKSVISLILVVLSNRFINLISGDELGLW